jgi:hypothetical protein
MTHKEIPRAVAQLLIQEFTKLKAGDKQNRHTVSFYGKIKKFLPAEAINALENAPQEEASKALLEQTFDEICQKQGILVHSIMYHENFHSGK